MHYNMRGEIHNIKALKIDNTLSNPGEAADAAATGEAIRAVQKNLDAHAENALNPHGVTKEQVGLGNVDNTPDMDKPVSLPQENALMQKVDKVEGKGLSANDFTDAYKEKLDGIEAGANKNDFILGDGGVTTNYLANGAVTPDKLSADSKSKGVAIVLTVAGWSGNSQTVNVEGVTVDNNVIVAAAPNSREHYNDAEIYCYNQTAGKLAFMCASTPTTDITVNVIILV